MITRVVLAILALGGCSRSPAPTTAPAPPAPAQPLPPPELVAFPSGTLTLHGFLYRPAGPGPFPAIVYNHGSEELPGNKAGQAMFFVAHGFVLFVPHRRGHGRSRDAGTYVGKIIDANPPDSPALADEMAAQADDVMAAVAYTAALPYVDKAQVATVGCSFGGIESMLAAERGTGLRAAVDFAGASFMWARNPPLRDRLTHAARNAKIPVFFIQAENDADTTPSHALADEMQKAGKPMRIHIFPAKGTTAQDGHSFCIGGNNPPWGDEVLAFLADAMKQP